MKLYKGNRYAPTYISWTLAGIKHEQMQVFRGDKPVQWQYIQIYGGS